MTKSFVAAAVSLLVDDESYPDVKWSTPVSQLLRNDFVLSDSRYTEMVTIEDILSHRSGLPDQDDSCYGIYSDNTDTPKSVTRKLRHLPLSAPLRTKYQYCNIMYVVAVHLVETLTGKTFMDFLRTRIWVPLDMKDSYFGLGDVEAHGVVDRLAKGYAWDKEKGEYFDVDWPVQPEAAGAGEMKSTCGDFAKWLRCMIDRSGPISEAGHEELMKPRTIVDDLPNPFWSQEMYALGWSVYTYHGETIAEHGGCTNGFGSKMIYLPGKKWGVAILANTMTAGSAHEKICWGLIDDLLDVPAEQKFDWDDYIEREHAKWGPDTLEDIYPKTPSPRLPLSAPIESYTGKYWNAGYETMTVECKDGKLEIDATDRSWRFKLFLTHISGEFFTAERLDIDTRYKDLLRAEFRLDTDGSVSMFGVALIMDMKHELIWFRRIVA